MSLGFRRENIMMKGRYVLLGLIISYVRSLLPTSMKTFKKDEGRRSRIRDRHYTCTYVAIEGKPSCLESMSCTLIHMQLCELLSVHDVGFNAKHSPHCNMNRYYQPQCHQFSGITKEHDLSESLTSNSSQKFRT